MGFMIGPSATEVLRPLYPFDETVGDGIRQPCRTGRYERNKPNDSIVLIIKPAPARFSSFASFQASEQAA